MTAEMVFSVFRSERNVTRRLHKLGHIRSETIVCVYLVQWSETQQFLDSLGISLKLFLPFRLCKPGVLALSKPSNSNSFGRPSLKVRHMLKNLDELRPHRATPLASLKFMH